MINLFGKLTKTLQCIRFNKLRQGQDPPAVWPAHYHLCWGQFPNTNQLWRETCYTQHSQLTKLSSVYKSITCIR